MTVPARKPAPKPSGLWTADQFLDFYMTRPDEERWQLVDGLAIMMVPPSYVHQRIVGNVEELLRGLFRAGSMGLYAYGNSGLRIPGVSDFHPQPDIVVCAADAEYQYYADRFQLVVEVISPSNSAEMIERKLDLYMRHPDNRYCLVIDQDAVHVSLFAREQNWARVDLMSLDDVLKLPAFGFEARLAAIYDGTPLARQAPG
jgi:Uma2 family endonuclease